MAISISGKASNKIYAKGDVCLKINPFDNYRLFTLYDDWQSDDRKPLRLSDDQKIFLVFMSKNKEVRIPEYTNINTDYNVDKTNGQVLFKINDVNAKTILTMENHTFYITRRYEITDMSNEKVLSSDEEVLYTGQWKDESSTSTVEDYTSMIKKLQDLLAERDSLIKELQEANAKLIEQNVNLVSDLEELRNENETLNSQLTEYETKLSEYEDGNIYSGTVVGEGTHHTIISNREYTEDEMAEVLKELESKMMD